MKLTRFVIILGAVLIAAYDIVALTIHGNDATISVQLYLWAKTYPIIPFVFGVLGGHLFWPIEPSVPHHPV